VARLSPALGITLFVPTIVIPVSGVLMSIVSLMDIARDVRQIMTGVSRDPRDAPPPIDYTA
jgi:TRAP-type C4-dicarboxylate transport system permease small subunit